MAPPICRSALEGEQSASHSGRSDTKILPEEWLKEMPEKDLYEVFFEKEKETKHA